MAKKIVVFAAVALIFFAYVCEINGDVPGLSSSLPYANSGSSAAGEQKVDDGTSNGFLVTPLGVASTILLAVLNDVNVYFDYLNDVYILDFRNTSVLSGAGNVNNVSALQNFTLLAVGNKYFCQLVPNTTSTEGSSGC